MDDPNRREYEVVTARRPIISDEELEAEFAAIRETDARDGTNEFLEAAATDFNESEPDYEW